MKSPITGEEMNIVIRQEKLTFRKDEFEIYYHSYVCEKSKEEYTDDNLDEINMNQVYNQYRDKYGIPFTYEIKEIREKYGLSASKISEILGLGTNSYRLYESGEMPSVANGRLILAIKHPKDFIKQLQASESMINPKEIKELILKSEKIYEDEKRESKIYSWDRLMENSQNPNEYNGYMKPNYDIISSIILRLSNEMDLLKTKLNKLLFYIDFLHYKNTGFSMTGLTYRANPYGPTPSDYDLLYSKLEKEEKVVKIEKSYDNGIIGEIIQGINKNIEYKFSEKENEIINCIISKFKNYTATQIKEYSHKEKAWIENERSKNRISYQKYAYEINEL